jgi:hypothetical protein
MSRMVITGLLVVCVTSMAVAAQQDAAKPKAETKEVKIARALSAAPAEIAKDAKVVDRDDDGAETVLREGTNGFICFPGHPGVVGDVTYCGNSAALRWESDFMALKPKPSNTEPGIEYMLLGGTDWSATDPTATSGTPIKEPPHWMILWPFNPKTTGLSTEPKQTGSWIMWAGTPWSHLMINQHP